MSRCLRCVTWVAVSAMLVIGCGGSDPKPDHGATFADAFDSGHFGQLGGCTKAASEAVFGGGPVLAALVDKLDELDGRILEDQRMVKAEGRQGGPGLRAT